MAMKSGLDSDAAERVFDVLKPECESICARIMMAPLSDRDRAGLAAMVAAHFIGSAGGAMNVLMPDQPRIEVIEAVSTVIIDMAKRSEAH